MKRFLPLFLLAALFVPLVAHAGHWITEPLDWQISNQGGPLSTTGVWVRDTSKTTYNGANVLDTTAVFSPTGLGVVGQAPAGAVAFARDSLLLGWIILQSDTTIATTFSTTTMAIDGRQGGFGGVPASLAAWVHIDSVSAGTVANDNTVAIPIRAYGTFGVPRSLLSFSALRARSTAGVGIMYAARVFWRHWVPGDEGRR